MTDTAGDSASSQTLGYNITVNPALTIPSTTLADPIVGVPYAQSIPTAGGDGAGQFTSPNLPSWLTLNRYTGVLTGTPTTLGAVPITVTATDNLGSTVTTSLSLDVSSITPTPVQPTSISLTRSPDPVVAGQPISFVVLVTAATGVPTGTVSIRGLNGATLVLPLHDGVAAFQAVLPHGNYNVQVRYSGDPNYLPSVSASQSLVARSMAIQLDPDPRGQLVAGHRFGPWQGDDLARQTRQVDHGQVGSDSGRPPPPVDHRQGRQRESTRDLQQSEELQARESKRPETAGHLHELGRCEPGPHRSRIEVITVNGGDRYYGTPRRPHEPIELRDGTTRLREVRLHNRNAMPYSTHKSTVVSSVESIDGRPHFLLSEAIGSIPQGFLDELPAHLQALPDRPGGVKRALVGQLDHRVA